jgi:hypothetical protein
MKKLWIPLMLIALILAASVPGHCLGGKEEQVVINEIEKTPGPIPQSPIPPVQTVYSQAQFTEDFGDEFVDMVKADLESNPQDTSFVIANCPQQVIPSMQDNVIPSLQDLQQGIGRSNVIGEAPIDLGEIGSTEVPQQVQDLIAEQDEIWEATTDFTEIGAAYANEEIAVTTVEEAGLDAALELAGGAASEGAGTGSLLVTAMPYVIIGGGIVIGILFVCVVIAGITYLIVHLCRAS